MPKLSVTLVDAFGRTTTKLVEVEEQATLAEYVAIVGAYVAAIEGVTDLGVQRVDLIIPQTGHVSTPTAGANVDVGATFSGLLAGGLGKRASHKVPGIIASLVDADGSISITGAVSTYLDQFLTAGDLMLSDGETMEAWDRGVLDR